VVGDRLTELAGPVLREAAATELDLSELPGNSAKVRLILDLVRQVSAADPPIRILDVGAGGRYYPFSLWEPFAPLKSRIDLVGVDVANLEPTAKRAAELAFPVDLQDGGAETVVDRFGHDAFDIVVSTQVLEHLRDWRGALAQMLEVLKPGGGLYITCDSGDYSIPPRTRAKLAGKRLYAQATRRSSWLRARSLSGDWEDAPTLAALAEHAEGLGLEVKALRHYGLGVLKTVQIRLDARGRLLSLALEEALAPGDPGLYRLIYLYAVKPEAH
jgi:SAM-dependent methyltransferase